MILPATMHIILSSLNDSKMFDILSCYGDTLCLQPLLSIAIGDNWFDKELSYINDHR